MTRIDLTRIVTAEDKAAAARDRLKERLANHRWQFETGGLMLEGLPIRTDRETRAALTEAVNSLAAGLMSEPVIWKMAAGWAELSEAQLQAITAAVSAHVKASFAAERAVSEQIDALQDLAGFDVEAAFTAALTAP